MNSNTSRSFRIDLLRIISVLIVVISHYSFFPAARIDGTMGVAIFFMVSGYCMAFSTKGRTGLQFLQARFFRLAPALIVCATITSVGEHLFPDLRPDRLQGWKDYALNVVCLPFANTICDVGYLVKGGESVHYTLVDGAYWSLLVELRFYLLLWITVFVLGLRKPSVAFACASVLAAAGLQFPLVSKGNDFIPYLCFFAFGMGARDASTGDRWGYVAMGIAIVSFFALCAFSVTAPSMSFSRASFLHYAICFVVFAGVMRFCPDLKMPFVATAGILTYPFYLIHQDLGYLVIEGSLPYIGDVSAKILAFIFAVVCAIAVQSVVQRVTPLSPRDKISEKSVEQARSSVV